ncbi:hypothetical protein [Streptomyces mirabilis]|uniref:hypothetical protein n=1 Tax=Streptomyces mirabilis TaxID=68239 RepID=UPI00344413FA
MPVPAAARFTGAYVVLTDDKRIYDLLVLTNQLLDPGERLADRVCALRDQSEGVLVIYGTDAEALAAADIAVAVPDAPDAEAFWSADLVCADGLEDAWRIPRAVPAARIVSVRSVQPALAGSVVERCSPSSGRSAASSTP